MNHTHTHTQCWAKEYRHKSTHCLILFIWSSKTGKTITLSVKLYREKISLLGAEINYKGQEEILEMIERFTFMKFTQIYTFVETH